MRIMKLCAAVVVCLCLCSMPAFGSSQAKDGGKKVGILLVAFGSSMPSAQVSFDHIAQKVEEAYPELPVRWAYTSHIIRKKLARQGKVLDSPAVALAKMQDEGFTHVAVQSLHTIAGSEYHDLSRVVGAFARLGGFQAVVLGNPLLASQKDMERCVDAMLAVVPAERRQDEAVVFMGHGTHHPANAFYAALLFQLQRQDANVYLGTVEGYPEIDTLLEMLAENGVKKAYLMPFMSVAGDHARNDMAGAGEDSWQSILRGNGIETVAILKGTAEFDQFVAVWVDHLGEVLERF